MPKFMTYQRPTPVNKQGWGGRALANPYPPARRPAGHPAPDQLKQGLPPLPGGPKSR